MRMFVVISGNIASRKTTVGKILEKHTDWIYVEEPWEKNLFLDLFYQDKKRWAYSTQWEFFIERALLHRRAQQETDKNLILDRSVYDDRYVFAKMLYDDGYMNEREWQSYCKWWDILTMELLLPPTAFIYLRQSPEKSYELLLQRRRAIELQNDGVTLDYLRKLHKYYEDFIDRTSAYFPVIVVEMDNFMPLDNYSDELALVELIMNGLKEVIEYAGLQK